MAVSNSHNPQFIGGVRVGNEVAITSGAGAPTHAAAKGSMYIRTDGTTTATRVYVCSVATGTWVSLTASA